MRVLKIILLSSLLAGFPGFALGAFRADFFGSLQERIQQIQQNSSTASTTIRVYANTGGNKVSGGTVSTGNASATVQVTETINGTSSAPVEINISADGEEKKIEKEIKNNGSSVNISVEVTSGNKKATSTFAPAAKQNIITKTLRSIKSLFTYVLSFF